MNTPLYPAGPEKLTVTLFSTDVMGLRHLQGLLLVAGSCLLPLVSSAGPDWSADAMLPEKGHRQNILDLAEDSLQEHRLAGLQHALHYPVTSTGLLIPYRPIARILESQMHSAFGEALGAVVGWPLTVNSLSAHFDWMGLTPYPSKPQTEPYVLPPRAIHPNLPMGASLLETAEGTALTMSCATCHSDAFFGTSVLGLSNRRLRASEMLVRLKNILPYISDTVFALTSGADAGEQSMYTEFRARLDAIGVIAPQAPGLDTSLSQVALSMSRRDTDAQASRHPAYEQQPRPNPLTRQAADSKPSVWWSLKYKTRWLSDGSLVSGNPILTNLLWNEIGRGSDLPALREWIEDNQPVIDEMTAAVFATEAPRWADFFPLDEIDLPAARRGEALFEAGCSTCHGSYRKAWSDNGAQLLSEEQQMLTVEVIYHPRTPVMDVGTDPGRWRAMQTLAPALNRLDISQWMETAYIPQQGYVPPPLEGLFARYPYLHNNAIPNLCALLNPPSQRPQSFYQGPAHDPATDFDFDCVGYPTGDTIPAEWKIPEWRVDTHRQGLSSMGHYEMMLLEGGRERFTRAQKQDLIEFLKTL